MRNWSVFKEQATPVFAMDGPPAPPSPGRYRSLPSGGSDTGSATVSMHGAARRVLSSLLNEVQNTSLLVCVVSSIVNAAAGGRKLKLSSSITGYLPPSPLVFPAAISGLTVLQLDDERAAALQMLYARLDFAKELTIGAAVTPGSATADIDWTALVDVWARVAGQALAAIYQLEALLPPSDAEHGSYRKPTLSRLLTAVRDGASPCVGADGLVVVPGWAERRQYERKPINAAVWLWCAGARRQAMMQDASQGGIGLTGCQGIGLGDKVSIELESGRVLDAVVAWSYGDQAGVRLFQPLVADDPLLR